MAFPAGVPLPAICPDCQTLNPTMHCVQSVHEPIAQRDSYGYECGCGTSLEIAGPLGFDPSLEISSYVATGQNPRSVNVSVRRHPPGPAPHFAYSLQSTRAFLTFGTVEPGPEPPVTDLRSFEGSFVGYRAWALDDWKLIGTGRIPHSLPWKPGVNTARCAMHEHPAPYDGCDCGLYALARFDRGSEWWRQADVLGAVEAWADEAQDNHDRFFVHRTGFRAQYAKIILLATDEAYPRAKNGAIVALAKEHGADVCKRPHLEAAASEHGQLVPDDVLAWAGDDDLSYSMAQQMQALRHTILSGAQAMRALGQAFASPSIAPPSSVPRGPKGIKQTLGYSGPPGFGQHRRGDRVKDSRKVIWQCTSGGKPGTWARED